MSEPTVKELFYSPSGDPTDPGGGGGSEVDWDNIVDKPSGTSEWRTETGFGTIVTFAGNQNLRSTDDVTFGSATLSNLTSGRVATVGTSGLLQDSANLTFDGTNLALASATFGANNALTGTLGDARYGQLGAANTWTAGNVFTAFVQINNTGQEQLRLKGGSGDPFLSFWNADTNRLGFIQYNNTEGNMKFASERGGIDFLTGTGGTEVLALSLTSDQNAEFSGNVEKDDFTTGVTDFSGTGWQGTSAGDFNIRNLIVRESARFRELIIDQLSIIAGSDLLSVARGKIESIDTGANTVTIEDPNNRGATRFAANDFFWVKSVDIDNSTIIDLKGQITSITGVTLTLDTTVTGGTHAGGTTDISSLSVGDVIAQRGHPTTTNRQSLIYRTVSDSDAPVEKFLDGIDSLAAFDDTANIVVEIGPTSGHFGANNILTYSPNEVGLAGFTADSNSLIRTEGTIEITMGSPNAYATSAVGFHVGSDANNRIFMGELAGNYEIFANNAGNILFRLGSNENRIAGSYFDSTDLWGGSATKANATVRLDFANGQIIYDGLTDTVIGTPQTNATYGQNTSDAPSYGFTNNWSCWVTQSGVGSTSSTTTRVAKRFRVRYKFGATKLVLIVWAKRETTAEANVVTVTHTSEIRVEGGNITNTSQTITATSYTRHTIEVPFSAGLSDGADLLIELQTHADVEILATDGANDTATTETFLNDDLIQIEQAAS